MTPKLSAQPTPRRVLGRFVAVIAPLLLLTACTGQGPGPSATPSATPTGKAWESTYAPPAVTQLAPLRGVPLPAGGTAHPSLAAKIDNHTAARPQFGLDRTDIVFEELVEGGLTRYVAVWQSDIPDSIGPVRSIRPMDPDIITPLGGIAAYSGGQQVFLDMMKATPVLSAIFDYDTTGLFSRVKTRSAPHNVVLKAADLVGRHTDLAPPAQQFAYATGIPGSSAMVDGTPVSAINTRFSTERWPSWVWDAAGSSYLRSQEGAPDLDGAGAQLKATNLLVLRVAIDGTYGEVPKTTMIGSGEASVSAGGKTVHATWSKESQGARIRLVDDNGTMIRLAPGNTWIELVPADRGSVELVP